jgi:hypothetical protein
MLATALVVAPTASADQGGTDVTFSVDPGPTATPTPTPTSSASVAPTASATPQPAATGPAHVLATTGTDVDALVALGIALVGIGLATVSIGQLTRPPTPHRGYRSSGQ